jgi:hypothetical protein
MPEREPPKGFRSQSVVVAAQVFPMPTLVHSFLEVGLQSGQVFLDHRLVPIVVLSHRLLAFDHVAGDLVLHGGGTGTSPVTDGRPGDMTTIVDAATRGDMTAIVDTATRGGTTAIMDTATRGATSAIVDTATRGATSATVDTATCGDMTAIVHTAARGDMPAIVHTATRGDIPANVDTATRGATVLARDRHCENQWSEHHSWASRVYGEEIILRTWSTVISSFVAIVFMIFSFSVFRTRSALLVVMPCTRVSTRLMASW